jgi:hypothetical protein
MYQSKLCWQHSRWQNASTLHAGVHEEMIDKFTLLKIVSTKSVGSELAFSLLQLLVSPLTPTVISIVTLLDLAQFVTPWRQRQRFGVKSLDNFNIGVKSPDTSDVSVSQSPRHNQMIKSLQLLAPYALQQLSAPTLIWRCFTLIDHCVGNSPQFSYWSIISVYNRMIDCPYGLTRISCFRVNDLYIASRTLRQLTLRHSGIFLMYIGYPYPNIELLTM